MAIVANVLPIDVFTQGEKVLWFDPTGDVAGRKTGRVTKVAYGASGTDKVVLIDVQPDAGGSVLTAQDASLFRVVDRINTVPVA